MGNKDERAAEVIEMGEKYSVVKGFCNKVSEEWSN